MQVVLALPDVGVCFFDGEIVVIAGPGNLALVWMMLNCLDLVNRILCILFVGLELFFFGRVLFHDIDRSFHLFVEHRHIIFIISHS